MSSNDTRYKHFRVMSAKSDMTLVIENFSVGAFFKRMCFCVAGTHKAFICVIIFYCSLMDSGMLFYSPKRLHAVSEVGGNVF